jgi:hypothetical protein
MKKTINFEGKKIKLPFPVGLSEDPTAMGSVANRFTGEKAALPEFAIAVYDVIMGSEQLATNHDRQVGEGGSPYWKSHAQGLDWFRQYFPKQYMTLLD